MGVTFGICAVAFAVASTLFSAGMIVGGMLGSSAAADARARLAKLEAERAP